MKRNLEVREGQFRVEVLPGIYEVLFSISVTTKKIKNHQVVVHTYDVVLGRQGRSSRPFSATEGVEASLDYMRPCLKIQRKNPQNQPGKEPGKPRRCFWGWLKKNFFLLWRSGGRLRFIVE